MVSELEASAHPYRQTHLLHDIHPRNKAAKNHVFPIQVRGCAECNKELRAIGVGPRVGHREKTGPRVRQRERLVAKFAAIDGLAAAAVPFRKVAALRGISMREGRK